MEFIVKDTGGDWHFDGDKTYWCLGKDKKPIGKIYAEYIPDPIKLWEAKCKSANLEINDPEARLFKTGNVATKLWEHKNASIN